MNSQAGKVALITGANKGLGKETARRLGRLGMTVLMGARDQARGETAAEELRSQGFDARSVTLDVTDQETIEDARNLIEREFGRLDVLVNNAGVSFERDRRPPSRTRVELLRSIYDTNLFGAIAVTNAMIELLRRSAAGRVVNVSTTMGSSSIWSDPESPQRRFAPPLLGYDTSKAALNAATVHYAIELEDTPVKVNAASPGYVATDLNDHQGQLAVDDEDSIAAVIRLATLPDDGPAGEFHSTDGPVPW
ncbi:MAG TPA: SDR family oxidoreductase [Solirubrobacteraceae bacterium]|jgi:NAD(P)-dependent dehydrogenase (short-subunit alcohol dehydrogenase family)